MPPIADTDTQSRFAAVARVAAAEMTLPRAVHSTMPLVRLVGWMLVAEGGTWTGTMTQLWERLQEEAGAAPDAAPVALGANASTFGRRLFAAVPDMIAVGLQVETRYSGRDGVRVRRLVLSAPDIRPLTRAPESEAFAHFAEEMIVSCDFEGRNSAAEFYTAFCAWCAVQAIEPWAFRTFCIALKREAEKRGAYPAVIDGRKGWKGIRLPHVDGRATDRRLMGAGIAEAIERAVTPSASSMEPTPGDADPAAPPPINAALRIALALSVAALVALTVATFLARG
jgi:hypothetical protein